GASRVRADEIPFEDVPAVRGDVDAVAAPVDHQIENRAVSTGDDQDVGGAGSVQLYARGSARVAVDDGGFGQFPIGARPSGDDRVTAAEIELDGSESPLDICFGNGRAEGAFTMADALRID